MVKKESKLEEIHEDVEELSPEWKRELKRRVVDARNPVRYVVFSDIGGKGRWRLWLDVSSDGYGMSIEQATLFKREHVDRAVARRLSENGYFFQTLRQAQIIILEILQCIPVVIISAFPSGA
jgi:hypothetical protein